MRWLAVGAVLVAALCPAAVADPPSPETACSLARPEPTLLVGARTGAGPAVRAAVARLGGTVVGGLPALRAIEATFPVADVAARALRADPAVRFADVERTYTVLDNPVDPLYGKQWGLRKVSAPKAWSIETGTTAPVTVAVLDTGADFGHPDLSGKLLSGYNAMDPNARPQDDHTHGTHVSGIIAAATNNRVGVAGMSWTAKILPVKALGADGSGTLCEIVSAILYVAAQAPDVLNMSIGGGGPCPESMQDALDLARANGVLPIAAAGNSGAGLNMTSSPANCDHVLGVAATDETDQPAVFSNYGPYVDVSAPGVNILSTVITFKPLKHTYAELSGTSMACPMVAGLAALLAARHPDWSPDQIAARIEATSADLGKKGWDEHYGYGRIDASRALR